MAGGKEQYSRQNVQECVCESLRGLHHDQRAAGLSDSGGRWGERMLGNVTGKVGKDQ